MEIRTLRYFLAVAREENMTRAAEVLHVTQPTLSKQLKSLEDELGKKLFTRHSFSIRLTDESVLSVKPTPRSLPASVPVPIGNLSTYSSTSILPSQAASAPMLWPDMEAMQNPVSTEAVPPSQRIYTLKMLI